MGHASRPPLPRARVCTSPHIQPVTAHRTLGCPRGWRPRPRTCPTLAPARPFTWHQRSHASSAPRRRPTSSASAWWPGEPSGLAEGHAQVAVRAASATLCRTAPHRAATRRREVYAGSTPYIVAADGTFARNPRFLHYPPGRQPPSEVHALIKRCVRVCAGSAASSGRAIAARLTRAIVCPPRGACPGA